jgi:hypothetical protein
MQTKQKQTQAIKQRLEGPTPLLPDAMMCKFRCTCGDKLDKLFVCLLACLFVCLLFAVLFISWLESVRFYIIGMLGCLFVCLFVCICLFGCLFWVVARLRTSYCMCTLCQLRLFARSCSHICLQARFQRRLVILGSKPQTKQTNKRTHKNKRTNERTNKQTNKQTEATRQSSCSMGRITSNSYVTICSGTLCSSFV